MSNRSGSNQSGPTHSGAPGKTAAPEAIQDADRAHAKAVNAMFGRIAGWYDFLNHFLSAGQDIYWRYRLVRMLRPVLPEHDGIVLDLAAGTLDVTLEILRQRPGARVLAMDYSLPMLLQGARKVPPRLKDRVALVRADGRTLPLPDASVHAATIAFGIRNILPRPAAHAEVFRVLKPGGRYLILEFGSARRPILKGFYNFYLKRLLPLFGRIFSGDSEAYGYLARTIAEFPDAPDLAQELRAAGFARVAWTPLFFGVVNIHAAEKGAPV